MERAKQRKWGGLSTLVTLAATAVAIAVATAIATIIIITLIGAGSDAVCAQVFREGIFAKSAGVHDLYNKVSVPVRVYNRLTQVMAAPYIQWSVTRHVVEKQVRHGLTPYATTIL